MGDVYLHYQSPLRLAERWAACPWGRRYGSIPTWRKPGNNRFTWRAAARSRCNSGERALAEWAARSRAARIPPGRRLRNICWSATARRGKLVSKLYQAERSQTIWLVIDCGRLMQARIRGLAKLDYAVNTALCLAEVALYSGDRVGLLADDRAPSHRVLPQRGSAHLRQLMEQLVDLRSGTLEADHLRAVSVLMNSQKRRSLVIWLTDLAETAMTPEVIEAALQLTPAASGVVHGYRAARLAGDGGSGSHEDGEHVRSLSRAGDPHRRQILLARMRDRGALLVEVDTAAMSAAVVNAYLDIKQQNRL